MAGRRLAIVLFNLGGPDRPDSVQPFLFNLFNDPAILRLPGLPRWLLAKFISARRAPKAREIYAQMGGGSPILPNTQAQAKALQQALSDLGEAKVFVAMRYWHPMTEEVVRAVMEFAPTEVLLLPLYPQFSTTTTGSSLRIWNETARRLGLHMPSRAICCYPDQRGYVAAIADLTGRGLTAAKTRAADAGPLVVFSAHGLPKKIVDAGDPYQAQVEASVRAVVELLGLQKDQWIIAYQSRVGPLEWIGPATDEVIAKASREKRAIIVAPVAFVSEHSETLVELDIEYRHLAEREGAAAYIRVSTVGTHPDFINGLAELVRQSLLGPLGVEPGASALPCADWSRCACKQARRGV